MDQHGQPFVVDEQRGRAMVLAFGYTHCPDICPATLLTLRHVRVLLAEEARRVRFVFVTTDPDRDSPERLRWYLSFVDPEFVGLTGAPQVLVRFSAAFNVYPAPYVPATGYGYRVGHATAVYLVDAAGRVRFSYPWGIPAQELAEDIRAVLEGH
jgi:protein SCO1/2